MNSWEYAIADQFLQGTPTVDIADSFSKSSLEIMEILQSEEVRIYMDQIREMKRMELEALADGPALQVMREGLNANKDETKITAADKIWKASGKYDEQSGTVATLAEILKRVMDDGKE